MKKKKMLVTSITIALFSGALFFAPDDAGAWGSSSSSWSDRSSSSWSGDSYQDSTIEVCLRCHGDLDRFPRFQYENPDKHHLLVGHVIPRSTIAPYETFSDNYECLTCHALEQIDEMTYQVSVERNCLQCHPVSTVTGSPRSDNLHHDLRNYRCNDCHGWGR
ncbi:MAG: multiheme c-type cytochrome [Pseudomonadota bacterium]